MNNAGMIVALLSAVGGLALALRGFRGREMSRNTTIVMALAWIAIIAGLAFIITQFGGAAHN